MTSTLSVATGSSPPRRARGVAWVKVRHVMVAIMATVRFRWSGSVRSVHSMHGHQRGGSSPETGSTGGRPGHHSSTHAITVMVRPTATTSTHDLDPCEAAPGPGDGDGVFPARDPSRSGDAHSVNTGSASVSVESAPAGALRGSFVAGCDAAPTRPSSHISEVTTIDP